MEILAQVIWYSLVASAVYALIAVGLTLTFGVLEFINFAHGEMALMGAYLLFAFTTILHLAFWPAFILVTGIMMVFGVVLEKLTFKPVRKSHAFKPLIISIGISAFLQSVVILFFGAGVLSYRQAGEEGPKTFTFFDGNLVMTDHQILLIVITAVLLTALAIFFRYSKTGKAIRAVGDNKEVAAILGINVDRTISIIFGLGTGLAGIAGMLIGGEQNLNPTMGIQLSIYAFAAVVLGGLGNVWAALFGAVVIGFLENFLVAFTPVATNYRSAAVFFILIVILMLKPNGIIGASVDAEVRK